MSYLPQEVIDIKAGRTTDAFNRLRVSNPSSLFDAIFEYDDLPFYWNTHIEGNGSTTHLNTEAAVALTVGTASGDRVVRQTKKYLRYAPGKGTLVYLTAVLDSKPGVVKRAGYFDDYSGLFFENDGNDLRVVKRDDTDAVIKDIGISRSQWNIDKMDGTGPSGISLDVSKAQLFVIDFAWLGLGSVRFGVYINGEIRYVHRMDHSNTMSHVYIGSPHCPIRYEILNKQATTSESTLKQICSVVIVEGTDQIDSGLVFGVGTGANPVRIGTRRPVLSIRPKFRHKGKQNRTLIFPTEYTIFSAGNTPLMYEIVVAGTLTGASWKEKDAISCVEYDTSATSISGGFTTNVSYLMDHATKTHDGGLKVPFTTNYDCTESTIITLVVTSLGANTDVHASVGWREVY